MTYETYLKDDTLDLSDIKPNILFDFGTTSDTLDAVEVLKPFLDNNNPLHISIQNSAIDIAQVLIKTSYTDKKDSKYQLLINSGFKYGYGGEGANGLIAFLQHFGIPKQELEYYIFPLQNKDKRFIINIK